MFYKTNNLLQIIEPTVRFFAIPSGKNICYHVNRNFHINHHNSKKLIIKNYILTQTQQLRFNYFITEITSAHNFIKNSEAYSKTMSPSLLVKEDLQFDQIDALLQKSWISMSNEQILENFELLSHYANKNSQNLEDSKYQGVLEVLKSKCHEFTDKDIQHLLTCLELWNVNKDDPNFKNLYLTIDRELLKRYEKWSIDDILYTNHQFFKLRIQRVLDFTWYSLRKIGAKAKHMTQENLIHFAFLLKLNRNIPINMYNIEYYTEQYVDKLTADELGIVAMAFVKYETVIRSNNFICKIIEKCINNIDSVAHTSLVAISQVLRCNDDQKTEQQFEKLFDALETQVDKLPLATLSHIFLLQRKILMHHKNFTLKALKRYEKEIEYVGVRDIERVLLTLFTFNYDFKTTPFYLAAMKELLHPRKADRLKPNTLVFAAEYLLATNYLPEEILNIIMQPEYIDEVTKGDKYNLNREYLSIDYMLEIEHPEYTGLRLDDDLKVFLLKRFGALFDKTIHKFQKMLYIHKMIPEMANTCKNIFNSESVAHIDSLLPHFSKTMVVLCFNGKTNEVISPAEKLSEYPVGSIKYAPKDSNKWYALVAGPRINVDRKTLEPFGYIVTQMRQLEKIGYIPIFIPHNVWFKLSDDNEKENYLKKLLDR